MNKQNYHYLIACIIVSISIGTFTSHAEPIMLKDPVIHLIDGLPMGLNGEKIGFMLKIRLKIKTMQYGIQHTPDTFEGIYIFQNKKYSVNQLTQIEAEFKKHHNSKHNAELTAVLAQAKQDFVKEIMSFMDTARGVKKHITKLIDESCKRRNRKDSELRRWSTAKEGEEEKQFHDSIQDFKTFDSFCTDLSNFLEDLIHSCPKGRKQLQQMIASHQHK